MFQKSFLIACLVAYTGAVSITSQEGESMRQVLASTDQEPPMMENPQKGSGLSQKSSLTAQNLSQKGKIAQIAEWIDSDGNRKMSEDEFNTLVAYLEDNDLMSEDDLAGLNEDVGAAFADSDEIKICDVKKWMRDNLDWSEKKAFVESIEADENALEEDEDEEEEEEEE